MLQVQTNQLWQNSIDSNAPLSPYAHTHTIHCYLIKFNQNNAVKELC